MRMPLHARSRFIDSLTQNRPSHTYMHTNLHCRLAAEREAGERRIAEERAGVEARIEKVRSALAERYEQGFKPLLAEAEARHTAELQRLVDLQRLLEAKEVRAPHAWMDYYKAKEMRGYIAIPAYDPFMSSCEQLSSHPRLKVA